MVSVLASGTQDRGMAEAVGFFGGEAKPSVLCRTFCGMLKTPGNYVENLSAISRPFPFLATRGLSCHLTWSASGIDGRN